MTTGNTAPRILTATEGDVLGALEAVRDRFMIDAPDTDGRFALLQHLMPGKALAAPLHRHEREDEYSFVVKGRLGARLGDNDVFAEAGDLVFKPRGQWHTFWNAGDSPAVILELISPGGLEGLFREMHAVGDALVPEKLALMAAQFGCEIDFEGTGALVERHGLVF